MPAQEKARAERKAKVHCKEFYPSFRRRRLGRDSDGDPPVSLTLPLLKKLHGH